MKALWLLNVGIAILIGSWAATAQAGVVITSVKSSSALVGYSLHTLTAVSDDANEPILGFDFSGNPDNNDPATGLGFFGPLGQVNPVSIATIFQDNNVFFVFVGRNPNEDSQFLFNTQTDASIVPSAPSLQEGANILQATFAFAEPKGLSVPFVQLVIPDAATATVSYRGDVLVGQSGQGINKRVQGMIITSHNLPPAIQPILRNVTLGVNEGELANLQLLAVDEFLPADELVWSDLVVAGPGKNPAFPGATDPQLNSDGIFNWNPNGWRGGQYKFTATVADELSANTTVALTVNLTVPEPASLLLVGLAVAALGAARVGRRE